MAKKKIELEKPEEIVTPEIIENAEVIEEEIPTELAEIKKEYGLKLSDDKVEAHIVTYAPYFKQLVDLENELNDLLTKEPSAETAKEATDLRKKYLKIRTGSKNQKDFDKADINIEGKFLDTVYKRIEAAAALKEEKCREIEEHLANLEAKRVKELSEKREAMLNEVNYGDSSFLPLGEMSDEAFNRLYDKQKQANEDAELRKQTEEKEQEELKKVQERTNARIAKIMGVGLSLGVSEDDPEKPEYVNDSYELTLDFLQKVTDEKFEETYEVISKEFEAEKKEAEEKQKAEKEKTERRINRINALTSLGFVWDAPSQSYKGFEKGVDLATINDADSEDFKNLHNELKKHVEALKAQKLAEQKKKDDEAEALRKKNEATEAENKRLKDAETARLKKIEDDKAEKARQEQEALKAPDKEKFKVWYLALKAHLSAFPEMTSEVGKSVEKEMKETITLTINIAKKEANKFV